MKEKFDFDRVGKRMPYTVPDDFFAEMEANVRRELEKQPAAGVKKPRPYMRIVMTALTTAAAVAALVLVLNRSVHVPHPVVGFAEVEQAFGNLAAEDQTYLVSVYQDDIFMNE